MQHEEKLTMRLPASLAETLGIGDSIQATRRIDQAWLRTGLGGDIEAVAHVSECDERLDGLHDYEVSGQVSIQLSGIGFFIVGLLISGFSEKDTFHTPGHLQDIHVLMVFSRPEIDLNLPAFFLKKLKNRLLR